MLKASRTPRRAQAEPKDGDLMEPMVEGNIFDHFPDAPKELRSDHKEEPKGPSTEELLARLEAMNAKIAAQDAEFARAMSMRTPEPAPATPLEQPKLNLDGLPDPVTHAAEYAAMVIQRGREYDAALNEYSSKSKGSSAPLGDPDALFQDFVEAYPDYAEDDTRMRFVTGEVTRRLAARGVDVQRYMFTQSGRFFDDLTKTYDKIFGTPTEETDERDEAEVHVRAKDVTPRRRRKARSQVTEEEGDDGRTGGILSSEGSGGHGRRTFDKQPSGTIEELQDIQRKTGYF